MAQYQVQDPAGQTHTIEGPDNATPEQVIQAAQQVIPAPSGMESAGRALVNNLPLGGQLGALGTEAMGAKDYPSAMKEWNGKANWAKEENPIAYGAGAVAGTAAPLAIPGVGEAMASSPIATNTALGAANAVGNTNLTKSPKEDVKQALEGAGIGATIGGVAKGLGKTVEPALNEAADELTQKGLNLRPGMLGKLQPEERAAYGELAKEAGAAETNTQEALNNLHMFKTDIGKQIGDAGIGVQPVQDIKPYLETLHDKFQQVASLQAPEAKQEAQAYMAGIQDLQNQGKTWGQLAQLKQKYGNWAFDANHAVKNQAAADVYSTIKDAMKSITKSQPEAYQELMNKYSMAGDIENGLQAKLGKESTIGSGGGFGVMGAIRNLPKPVRATVGTGATVLGHPYLGAMAAIPELANPLNQAAALRMAPSLGHITEAELNDYMASQENKDAK